jgi:hypothetical protein
VSEKGKVQIFLEYPFSITVQQMKFGRDVVNLEAKGLNSISIGVDEHLARFARLELNQALMLQGWMRTVPGHHTF